MAIQARGKRRCFSPEPPRGTRARPEEFPRITASPLSLLFHFWVTFPEIRRLLILRLDIEHLNIQVRFPNEETSDLRKGGKSCAISSWPISSRTCETYHLKKKVGNVGKRNWLNSVETLGFAPFADEQSAISRNPPDAFYT